MECAPYQAECINLGRAPGALSTLGVSAAQLEKVKHQEGSTDRRSTELSRGKEASHLGGAGMTA